MSITQFERATVERLIACEDELAATSKNHLGFICHRIAMLNSLDNESDGRMMTDYPGLDDMRTIMREYIRDTGGTCGY